MSRWAAFRSRRVWAALGVLIVNDHWLKHASLLPGWLTGKLSDLAGLVVAPLFVAGLIGARHRAARAFAFGLVALPFAAIKTCPAATEAVEAFSRFVHLDWRLWCDPTDLVALAVFPSAWRIASRAPSTAPAGKAQSLRERFGAAAAALACMATSRNDASQSLYSSLSFVNVMRDPVTIQVFRPPSPLPCQELTSPEQMLVANDFAFEGCHDLSPFTALPLDLDATGTEATSPPQSSVRACDAVVIRADGLAPTVLFFQHQPASTDVTNASGRTVAYLNSVGDTHLVVIPPPGVQAWTAQFALPAIACP